MSSNKKRKHSISLNIENNNDTKQILSSKDNTTNKSKQELNTKETVYIKCLTHNNNNISQDNLKPNCKDCLQIILFNPCCKKHENDDEYHLDPKELLSLHEYDLKCPKCCATLMFYWEKRYEHAIFVLSAFGGYCKDF